MKNILSLYILALLAFVLVYSCSLEEEDTSPPPSIVITPKPEPTPAPVQYTLTVTAGEGGTVSTEGGTFDEGTEVTITATPDEGYEFVGWEGSDSDSISLSVTLNANTTVQALFQSLPFVSTAERYSAINETTGYYYTQKYFKNYFDKEKHQSLTFEYVTENETYSIFGRDMIFNDFDNNGQLDLFGFATQFHSNVYPGYGVLTGKYLMVKNYEYIELEKKLFESEVSHAGGKIEINDFNNDGNLDVLFQHHNEKLNLFIEEENVGGQSNLSSLKPKIIQINSDFEMTINDVGIEMSSHCGASGDLDNDGDIDFIQMPIGGTSTSQLNPIVNVNEGSLNFTSKNLFTNHSNNLYSLKMTATAMELFDLDNDNNLDLIIGDWINTKEDKYPCISEPDDPCPYRLLYNPIIIWGNSSSQFSLNDITELNVNSFKEIDVQASILGFGFTDFDSDGDIDLILSNTRAETFDNGGNMENGYYYNNYYLSFLENLGNRNFSENTNIIQGSFDQSTEFPNFYYIRSIDKDNDGDYDLVPDGVASWGSFEYIRELYWENTGGQFVRRKND